MKTNRFLKQFFVAVFFLAGCAAPQTAQRDDDRQAIRGEVEDELSVGRLMAAKLLGHFGNFDGPPAVSQYVSLLGKSLAQQFGRPELEFHFGILNSSEENAFATPGGYIFVTRGLLKSLRNESELACVLGHEMAHVNQKHMYDKINPKREIGAGETITRLLSRGRADIGGSLNEMVNQGLKLLLQEGLGEEKEFEADQAGITYASLAGYSADSLGQLLDRMKTHKEAITQVLQTHPPFELRKTKLNEFILSNGLSSQILGNLDVLKKRFTQAIRSLHTTKL